MRDGMLAKSISRSVMAAMASTTTTALGTITGSFGGMMRDILINEEPLIFRKDIYALACVFGGGVYYLCMLAGLTPSITQFAAALGIFLARIIAVKYHISVPVLKGEE